MIVSMKLGGFVALRLFRTSKWVGCPPKWSKFGLLLKQYTFECTIGTWNMTWSDPLETETPVVRWGQRFDATIGGAANHPRGERMPASPEHPNTQTPI